MQLKLEKICEFVGSKSSIQINLKSIMPTKLSKINDMYKHIYHRKAKTTDFKKKIGSFNLYCNSISV